MAQISFGPSREIGDAFSTGLSFARAADMDGDGDLDVIACEQLSVRVLWWENDGAGNFSNRREWLWGDLYWDVIGLDDWNGDGRPDVWLRQNLRDSPLIDYYVAVANPDGTISPPQPLLIGVDPGSNTQSVELIVNLNGDSHPDLISGAGVFYAQPDGSFTSPPVALPPNVELPPLHERERANFSTLDWDGDGWSDILNDRYSHYTTKTHGLTL